METTAGDVHRLMEDMSIEEIKELHEALYEDSYQTKERKLPPTSKKALLKEILSHKS